MGSSLHICPICLETLGDDRECIIPPCKHRHCKLCFDWMCASTGCVSRGCSICRRPVVITAYAADCIARRSLRSMTSAYVDRRDSSGLFVLSVTIRQSPSPAPPRAGGDPPRTTSPSNDNGNKGTTAPARPRPCARPCAQPPPPRTATPSNDKGNDTRGTTARARWRC